MRVGGNEHKISTGVFLNVEHDLPVVGIIQDIFYLANEDKILFCVDQSSTLYEPHFRAYIVKWFLFKNYLSFGLIYSYSCSYPQVTFAWLIKHFFYFTLCSFHMWLVVILFMYDHDMMYESQQHIFEYIVLLGMTECTIYLVGSYKCMQHVFSNS